MIGELPRFACIEKKIGETPLQALERFRSEAMLPPSLPLAYAGRLDPMASGELLILIGEECKRQELYHTLDKQYDFEVLLGIGSDTSDVLGLVERGIALHPDEQNIKAALKAYTGKITLPYPHFSSKTVRGKPLHVWTLEERLDEITIPTKTSTVYSLSLRGIRTISIQQIAEEVLRKIETIPQVTDPRKALGKDFRRDAVRAAWKQVIESAPEENYSLLSLTCISSSGTYMRTLAGRIGEHLGTKALAYSIHRTHIGKYLPLPLIKGFFYKTFSSVRK